MKCEMPSTENYPQRIWPWVLAVAVVMGVALAVVCVRAEARRIHEQRQTEMPPSGGPIR